MIEKEKKNHFWDKEAKKPTKITFILLFALALSLFIWGFVETFSSVHEIKVEIDYSDDFHGDIEFQGTYEEIDDNMGNEYTYEIREGNEISVYVRKTYSPETLTVKIYDNDELVREESILQNHGSIHIEYTVGE